MRGKLRQTCRFHHYLGTIPASAGETKKVFPYTTRSRDYPRECGGNAITSKKPHIYRGLSPRVRGKRPQIDCWDRRRGTIPASAGETNTENGFLSGQRDYPRECGGNCARQPTRQWMVGLSPRVRGKPSRQLHPFGQSGTIPASAGETTQHPYSARLPRDYPRECGGNRKGGSDFR